ncbi:MAG: sugar ABC transporter permease [Eubacteriales bacterium]|nr:sugar ABC transporter permease [Eubacteriales bacterium]
MDEAAKKFSSALVVPGEEKFVSGLKRTREKKPRTIAQKRAIAGWIFISPFLIGFIFLLFPPIYTSLMFAFSDVFTASEGYAGFTLVPAGFKYAETLINDLTYLQFAGSSLATLGLQVLTIIIFSFVIANILNQKFKGRTVARAIFFLPVITSSAAIVLLNAFDPLYSTANNTATSSADELQLMGQILGLVEAFKLPTDATKTITGLVGNVSTMIKNSGVQILIFLSGLQSISPSLFESSKIEGATPWENFWKITFPMISPLILVNTVYTVIDSLSGLDNQLMNYLYTKKISQYKYSAGAMESWAYFLVVFAITGIVALIISKLVYYENE